MSVPTGAFRLALVRHGQTDWNKEERYRGRFDLSLDETGLRQAEATGLALRKFNIAAVYTSPLKRAMQTASAIADAIERPLFTSEELIDIDYGQWQGLTPAEAADQDGALYQEWLESPQTVSFCKGESLGTVEKRVSAALAKAMARHPNETVAMVSHKVVCKVFVCHILGLDLSHFWQVEQNLSAINLFEHRNNAFVATTLNDTCHLKGLGAQEQSVFQKGITCSKSS